MAIDEKLRAESMKLHETFTHNIKRLRLQRGWTQRDIADRLGMTQPCYAAIELGHYQPRLGTMAECAAVLDVSVLDLLSQLPSAVMPPRRRTAKKTTGP